MMLVLISEAISKSNAVIRQEFRKLRFQMIDDNNRRGLQIFKTILINFER